MKTKHILVLAGAFSLLPTLAQAQSEAAVPQSSGWANLLWAILPIILIVVIFIPLVRRLQKPIVKRGQEHMARQVQHMDRVEQSLDRIIKLLEKKE